MKIKQILPFISALALLLSCKNTNTENQTYIHPIPTSIDTNVILPPSWAFGVMYGGYTDQQGTIRRINEIIEHDYPVDAYWIDSWFWSFAEEGRGPDKYIDFVADTVGFPNREAMWDYLQKRHIKGGFWVWDCIFETGNEEAFNDFQSKGYFKDVYRESNPWHNNSKTTAMFQTEGSSEKGTLCGNIDFDNPEAVAYFKQRMKHFFDEGADFIKLDRTAEIHKCRVMFEMSQEFGKETKGRGLVMSHSFGTDNEEYKRYPCKWTDDTRSDWNIDAPNLEFNPWVPKVAFKENIAMYLDPEKKTSQIPFLTNDLGGFDMGITDSPNEELYIRWMQFSMFNPIVETFSQPENPTANMAYNYSQRADSLYRKYSHLHMELFPYFYTYAHQVRLKGEQIMQPGPTQIYDYWLGKEIFVAPVYEKEATKRTVGLPEGNWVNYWTQEILAGGQTHTVEAPIDQIPLFIKQGAIIPMRAYASSIEQGTNDFLTLHIYAGADGEFTLIEDDGTSNDYLKGIYSQTAISLKEKTEKATLHIAPAWGYYEGMNPERSWKISIHSLRPIQSVIVNGKETSFTAVGNHRYETCSFGNNAYLETRIDMIY